MCYNTSQNTTKLVENITAKLVENITANIPFHESKKAYLQLACNNVLQH